jgi:hypothetical protein
VYKHVSELTKAWCEKNQTFTAYITHKKADEESKEPHKGTIGCTHVDCDPEDFEDKYHNPDTNLLLWPEIGFITVFEPKFRKSFERLDKIFSLRSDFAVSEYLFYANILHMMNDSKAR